MFSPKDSEDFVCKGRTYLFNALEIQYHLCEAFKPCYNALGLRSRNQLLSVRQLGKRNEYSGTTKGVVVLSGSIAIEDFLGGMS